MTGTSTETQPTSAGQAFAAFLKEHAVLTTDWRLERTDPSLHHRVFDGIGALMDARIASTDLPVHIKWMRPDKATKATLRIGGTFFILSSDSELGALMEWVTNDDRSVLLNVDHLGIAPAEDDTYDVALSVNGFWVNSENLWHRRSRRS